MDIDDFESDYSQLDLASLHNSSGITQKDIEEAVRKNTNTVWQYVPGMHGYKYLYYLIGSCDRGYFLQVLLSAEAGSLSYLLIKKASDVEIRQDWCNTRN